MAEAISKTNEMSTGRVQSKSAKLKQEVAMAKEVAQREKHIETLEKYYDKYERKIKRNERALKRPIVLETPGFEGSAIPEDLSQLWMKDLILINARDGVRRTLPRHKQNLEILLADIEKLRLGRPTDEISPASRATLYTRKWGLGNDWKTIMDRAGGLWY